MNQPREVPATGSHSAEGQRGTTPPAAIYAALPTRVAPLGAQAGQ